MFIPQVMYFLDPLSSEGPCTIIIVGLNVLWSNVHVALWKKGYVVTVVGNLY